MTDTVQRPPEPVSRTLGVDQSRGELTTGSVYVGAIERLDPKNGVYECSTMLSTGKQPIPNCIYVGGFVSSMIGIKTHFMPLPGTRVLILYDNPAYIFATMESSPADFNAGADRTILGEDAESLEIDGEGDNPNFNGATRAREMYPGELEIGNQIGVAIQFLMTMVKLSAGERAKIECHLVDNLVRIVSGSYQHYNDFGTFEVINGGGGPTVRWEGTSKTHEAWGLEEPEDKKAKVDKRKVDMDSVAETARNRFSQFVGYLGDFIHILVTDPEKTIGQLAQVRDGKFHAHVNNDGGFLLQSVADIILERSVCIPVPIENKTASDSEGNTREEIEAMVTSQGSVLDQLLERWDYGDNFDRLHLLPYQLRHYARYLNQYHAYARMIAQEKDWTIPSESESYEEGVRPTWNNNEQDVTRANAGKPAYFPAYSIFGLLRDGSTVLLDAYGNATITGKEGVKASSYLDFKIEAARNVEVICGQDFLVMARRHIDLTSVVGQVLIKARTFLQMLCEWGSIHIKSDAPDPNDPEKAQYEIEAEDKLNESDPDPVVLEQAIFLEGSIGSVTVQGARQAVVESTGATVRSSERDDMQNGRGSVILRSVTQDVMMLARRNAWVNAYQTAGVKAGVSSLTVATNQAYFENVTLFDVNRMLTLKDGELHTMTIRAGRVSGEWGVYGPELGPQKRPSASTHKSPDHINHIFHFDDGPGGRVAPEDGDFTGNDFPASLRNFVPFLKSAPGWDYPAPAVYKNDAGDADEDRLPFRSLTQERLVDDALFADQYLTWNWAQNMLHSKGLRTGAKHPYAWTGESPEWQYAENEEPLLHVPTSTPADELNTVPDMTSSAVTMKYRKRV